jgi:hypothetical protein
MAVCVRTVSSFNRVKIQQQDDLRQSSCGIRYLFLTPRLSVSAIQRARPRPTQRLVHTEEGTADCPRTGRCRRGGGGGAPPPTAISSLNFLDDLLPDANLVGLFLVNNMTMVLGAPAAAGGPRTLRFLQRKIFFSTTPCPCSTTSTFVNAARRNTDDSQHGAKRSHQEPSSPGSTAKRAKGFPGAGSIGGDLGESSRWEDSSRAHPPHVFLHKPSFKPFWLRPQGVLTSGMVPAGST